MTVTQAPSVTGRSNRRNALIDAASEGFALHGFHAVSIRDIAGELHMSPATIYNYFDSKEALLLAVGERFYKPLLDRLENIISDAATGFEHVKDIIRVTFEDGSRYRNEFLTLSQDVRHILSTSQLAPLVADRDTCIDILRRAFIRGMQDGSVRTDLDPEILVVVVISGLKGILRETHAERLRPGATREPLLLLNALLTDGLQPKGAGVISE
jgi:TetR/AcrR family transcriptional regulator, cholesterol catabolism regulator